MFIVTEYAALKVYLCISFPVLKLSVLSFPVLKLSVHGYLYLQTDMLTMYLWKCLCIRTHVFPVFCYFLGVTSPINES